MFTEFATWLQSTPLSVAIQSILWVIPLVQSIHIVTIGIVFGSILMIALRILGLARREQPFNEVLLRFSPWIWIGLVVMTVTGVALVIGEPLREFTATSFWLKMGLIVIGVLSAAAFRYSVGSVRTAASGEPVFSFAMKSATVTVLLLWVAIIFLGRAIAYDTQVWESLSLSSSLT
jgi:hypothetical protein